MEPTCYTGAGGRSQTRLKTTRRYVHQGTAQVGHNGRSSARTIQVKRFFSHVGRQAISYFHKAREPLTLEHFSKVGAGLWSAGGDGEAVDLLRAGVILLRC